MPTPGHSEVGGKAQPLGSDKTGFASRLPLASRRVSGQMISTSDP